MKIFAAVLVLLLAAACEKPARERANHQRNMAVLQQFEKEQHDADPANWRMSQLLERLASRDHNARAEAATELVRRKDPAGSPALRRCLATEDHSIVVARCGQALLAIGLPEDMETVRTYVSANATTIDSLFIGALGQVDADWAEAQLKRILELATDNTRRAQVIQALEVRYKRLGTWTGASPQ